MTDYRIEYPFDRQTFYEKFRWGTSGGQAYGGSYCNDTFSLYLICTEGNSLWGRVKKYFFWRVPLVLSGTIYERPEGLLAEYRLNKSTWGREILRQIMCLIFLFFWFIVVNWSHHPVFEIEGVTPLSIFIVLIVIVNFINGIHRVGTRAQREALLKFMEDMRRN